MPYVVEINGRRHQIREGTYRVQEIHMDGPTGKRYTHLYTFNLPGTEVRIEAYEEPSYLMMSDGPIAAPPTRISSEVAHVKNFLVEDAEGNHYQEYVPRKNIDGEETISKEMFLKKFGHSKVTVPSEEREREKKDRFKEMYSRKPMPKGFGKNPKAEAFGNPSFWDKPPREKESSMPNWVTGSRVQFADPLGQDRFATGTVIEVKEGMPRGMSLVCLDKPKLDEGGIEAEVCGPGYGHLLRTADLRALQGVRCSEDFYRNVPEHIGVVAPEGFTYQKVEFPRNSVGRVITGPASNGMNPGDSSSYTVAWFNVRHSSFRSVRDGKREWDNGWSVPTEPLRWCRFQPGSFKVVRSFYSSYCSFAPGDYLVYTSEKPIGFPSPNGKHMQSYVVTPGVIFLHRGWDPDRACIQGTIAGGMAPEVLGTNLNLRKQDVRKFEGDFIPVGERVEIVAEIIFKKKSLQGSTAKIILPTDAEGDIGVEFPEDFGAGSLDGVGREGRCLYIPSTAVRRISG